MLIHGVLIFIGWKKAHNTGRYDITDIYQNSSQFIQLKVNNSVMVQICTFQSTSQSVMEDSTALHCHTIIPKIL